MSHFVLGTVQFGLNYGINNVAGKPTGNSTTIILNEAYASGISTLDTAPVYGDAESVIGEYQRTTGNFFTVNTKFSYQKQAVRESFSKSCARLNVDKINILFFHSYNDLLEYPQALKELSSLKQAGSIGSIGISVYDNDAFKRCIDENAIDVIQLPFNLLDNSCKRDVLMRKAIGAGKRLQVRSVFLQGLFFKEENSWPAYLDPLKKYNQHLHKIASQNGLSVYEMALGYALGKPEISEIVIGVDNVDQLKLNLSIASKQLDRVVIDAIDDIDVKEETLLYPYNWK